MKGNDFPAETASKSIRLQLGTPAVTDEGQIKNRVLGERHAKHFQLTGSFSADL